MLGLGDIVIPGIFVALVLRYDVRHARQTSFFNRCAPAGCEEGQMRYCKDVHVYENVRLFGSTLQHFVSPASLTTPAAPLWAMWLVWRRRLSS